jgi:flagellar assembly protein FliH
MKLLSKIIKACFVKEEHIQGPECFERKKAFKTVPTPFNPDIIATTESQEEFTQKTATAIYLETKEMINELITEAQKKAETIIFQAEKKAEELTVKSQAEYEKVKQNAYEEGSQAGYQDGTQKVEEESRACAAQMETLITELENLKKNYFSSHVEEILELVLQISQKVINAAIEFKPEIICTIVQNVLAEAAEAESITIKVNPVHLPYLDVAYENMQEKKRSKVKIEQEPGIKPGDCLVVTENGFIDAQIDEQMVILKQALKDEIGHAGLS